MNFLHTDWFHLGLALTMPCVAYVVVSKLLGAAIDWFLFTDKESK